MSLSSATTSVLWERAPLLCLASGPSCVSRENHHGELTVVGVLTCPSWKRLGGYFIQLPLHPQFHTFLLEREGMG